MKHRGFVRAVTCTLMVGLLLALAACEGKFLPGSTSSVAETATGGRPLVRLGAKDPFVVETIWTDAQWGFVRIEQVEEGAPPNDHPVKIAPEQIQSVLAELQIDQGGKSQALFAEKELKDISRHLSDALAKAGPGQDVTFASTGKPSEFLFIRPYWLNTGRMFYRDDKLNVIFGIIHGEFQSELKATGILRPYTPGSRYKQLETQWVVVPTEKLLYASVERPDWVEVGSLPAVPSVALTEGGAPPVVLTTPQADSTAAQSRGGYAPGGTPGAAAALGATGAASTPRAPATSAPSAASRQATTMARSEPKAPSTTSPSYRGSATHYQDIEDRLRGLQKLRQEGLITEREYQEKRRALLEQL